MVYATFVILTGTVHSTARFTLSLPYVEWTDPDRMTKVAYSVEHTTIWVICIREKNRAPPALRADEIRDPDKIQSTLRREKSVQIRVIRLIRATIIPTRGKSPIYLPKSG